MKGQTSKRLLRAKLQRVLRKNMTDAEQRLWHCLRGKQIAGHKFRRQHPYGDYVLDFVCLDARLIVEVDGGQHNELESEDAVRTCFLESAGFRVLRFWNNQVFNELESVKELIWSTLQTPPPSQPSP